MPFVLGRELDAHPPAEGRRACSYVNRHIEDHSLDDHHKLSLRLPQLVVQAPERPTNGSREVVLHERSPDASVRVLLGVVGLQKQPARILEDIGFNKDHALQFRFEKPHDPPPTRLIDALAPLILTCSASGGKKKVELRREGQPARVRALTASDSAEEAP